MHNGESLIGYALIVAAARAEEAVAARKARPAVSTVRRMAGTVLMQLGYRLNPSPPWPSVPSERGA